MTLTGSARRSRLSNIETVRQNVRYEQGRVLTMRRHDPGKNGHAERWKVRPL